MVEELRIRMVTPLATAEAAVRRGVLEALEADPLLAPTHGGTNERHRKPYDREALIGAARPNEQGFGRDTLLWRTRAPKYLAMLDCAPFSVNDLSIDVRKPAAAKLEGLYASATRLAAQLRVEHGLVQPVFGDVPAPDVYYAGYANGRHVARFGPLGIYARTWFGPYMVKTFGAAYLLSLPHASETPWGAIQVDLLPEPWNAEPQALVDAHAARLDQLRQDGVVLGDPSGHPMDWKPAPKWVQPQWNVGRV